MSQMSRYSSRWIEGVVPWPPAVTNLIAPQIRAAGQVLDEFS